MGGAGGTSTRCGTRCGVSLKTVVQWQGSKSSMQVCAHIFWTTAAEGAVQRCFRCLTPCEFQRSHFSGPSWHGVFSAILAACLLQFWATGTFSNWDTSLGTMVMDNALRVFSPARRCLCLFFAAESIQHSYLITKQPYSTHTHIVKRKSPLSQLGSFCACIAGTASFQVIQASTTGTQCGREAGILKETTKPC